MYGTFICNILILFLLFRRLLTFRKIVQSIVYYIGYHSIYMYSRNRDTLGNLYFLFQNIDIFHRNIVYLYQIFFLGIRQL